MEVQHITHVCKNQAGQNRQIRFIIISTIIIIMDSIQTTSFLRVRIQFIYNTGNRGVIVYEKNGHNDNSPLFIHDWLFIYKENTG